MCPTLRHATVPSIQHHSQSLAKPCHLVGCLTFGIIYILFIIIFIVAGERKRLPLSTFTNLSQMPTGTLRLFMKGVTCWTSQPGTIFNQDTVSGHGHLHPDMPQTPSSPWLFSVCPTEQGSLLEHSGITLRK